MTLRTIALDDGGIVEESGSEDVIDAFGRYQRMRNMSERTIARRSTTLKMFDVFLAPKGLTDATQDDVEEFLMVPGRAARTRHAYRSDLRVFYRWASKRCLVDHDPAADIEKIIMPKSLPRPLRGDLEALWIIGNPTVRRMTALGLYAGLRCAEIAGLDASDVNLHARSLTVRNGKGKKDRVLSMHPRLVEMLADLPASGPVFPNPTTGQPVKAKSVSAAIKRHLVSCGFDGVAHQLRHAFGTELARSTGGNLQIVADAMGHESMQTTKGYAELTPGVMAPAIAAMWGGDAA